MKKISKIIAKKYEKRKFRIAEMYTEEKKTLANIGEEMGLTRERIRQILVSCMGHEAINEFKAENKKLREIKRTIYGLCHFCGKQFKTSPTHKIYCSRECYKNFFKRKNSDPAVIEDRKKRRLEGIKRWRENHPEKVKEYIKRHAQRLRDNPEMAERYKQNAIDKFGSREAYLNYAKERNRLSYNRVKNDPIIWRKRQESNRTNSVSYYYKMKYDQPEKYEEYQKKHAEYYRKIREKLRGQNKT